MSFFNDELRTAYESAYSEFMKPKNYIAAKIYHGGKNFDLKKRWYVYYSFVDPSTGQMKRQPPITFKVNQRFKTKAERLHHLKLIQKIINDYLKKGWTPHKLSTLSKNYTAESCLDYALSVKKSEIKETTFKDYESRVNQFKKFLKEKGINSFPIQDISKKDVAEFLNKYEGSKNYNNGKIALKSIFDVLSSESYIERNFIEDIRNKKVTTKAVKIYSKSEVEKIVRLLEKENKTLLMYIYFESFMFWRPIEIVRIRPENINLSERLISVEVKTKAQKTKIIPEIIFNDLKEFLKDKKGYIFEPENSDWEKVNEVNRRDYYTKAFAKFRTKHKISPDFKLYSFRHTFITKIYLELRKSLNKEDTIKQLSLITGHESKAIYSYIQVNDIELPEDYSKYLK